MKRSVHSRRWDWREFYRDPEHKREFCCRRKLGVACGIECDISKIMVPYTRSQFPHTVKVTVCLVYAKQSARPEGPCLLVKVPIVLVI